ncbi:hypothetical protein T12_4222 [Trichinella patagoniensis]|uniref:Uncharacterized protein n=1 Tax=Trichinella patagoniensis TaxID=990121 RepID=A0A0V0YRV7_9BILA|nr:hypothetical protein T12_4222 [Trichinella patagoniensis]
MDIAGSHPRIRHLPQNCLAEMEITALDQGELKIANNCLRLKNHT